MGVTFDVKYDIFLGDFILLDGIYKYLIKQLFLIITFFTAHVKDILLSDNF